MYNWCARRDSNSLAGLHRAEHAAALGDRFELLQHRLFDEVGELVDDEGALVGIAGQTALVVDDKADRTRNLNAEPLCVIDPGFSQMGEGFTHFNAFSDQLESDRLRNVHHCAQFLA